jgi:hypothetical protein
MWTEGTGIVDVVTFLADHGITIPALFDVQSLTAVSDDGTVITGVGQHMSPPFNPEGFIIRLDAAVSAPEMTAAPEGASRIHAWPNPTSGGTTVSFELARATTGTLDVYDATGRLVRRILDGPITAGRRVVAWDGRDRVGARAAAGVYYLRFETETTRETRKLVIVR